MRVACIVFLVCLLLSAPLCTPSWSQIPHLGVKFTDEGWFQYYSECRGFLVADTLDVVATNFNMYMSTIEFGISPPVIHAYYNGDVHIPGALWIGNSVNYGVWITYPRPLNAFEPVVVMRIAVVWLCDTCNYMEEAVRVLPNFSSGLLRAVEWKTYRVAEFIGITSHICGMVATEQTTWGKVKALYR